MDATLADGYATIRSITVQRGTDVTDVKYTVNGSSVHAPDLALSEGLNVIRILVAAEDGSVAKTYTVSVDRAPKLVGVTLSGVPERIKKGESVQLKVEAAYSNGTTSDVTAEAAYDTRQGAAKVVISATGLLTAVKPGSTVVGAAYGGFVSNKIKTIVSP